MAGRILIADDVATNRIVMKVKLASAFYQVIQASSGDETLRMAQQDNPDLIILDANLGDSGGVDVLRALKANASTAAIPVIMATGVADTRTKLAALDAGADEFLCKPLDEMSLLARVRSLLRARTTSEELKRRESTARELGFAEAQQGFGRAGRVVMVADRPERALVWRQGLRGLVRHKMEVLPKERALEALPGMAVPDIFVISADLGDRQSGLQLLSELRSRDATRHCAVLVVHEAEDRNSAIMALDLGANDLIRSDVTAEEMALRLRAQMRRKHESDRLRETVDDGLKLALVDPLTGLYNRRYAMPYLNRIAASAAHKAQPYSVMLLDLDRFKSVNDTWGHAAGDAVLVEVSRRLLSHMRSEDMVARFGGEEFVIALPDTNLAEARNAAERLRRVISETPIPLPGGNAISITMSVGVSIGGQAGRPALSVETLIEDADRALFAAKAEGRNQVTLGAYAA
jgi:two-component system, cell cycle response regulator